MSMDSALVFLDVTSSRLQGPQGETIRSWFGGCHQPREEEKNRKDHKQYFQAQDEIGVKLSICR